MSNSAYSSWRGESSDDISLTFGECYPNENENEDENEHKQKEKKSGVVMKWECTHCTYRNPLISASCEMCSKVKAPNVRMFEDKSGSANGRSHRSSNHSNHSDLSQESNASSHNNNWSCQACTFENPGSSSKCGICNTPRPQEMTDESSGDFGVAKRMIRRERESQVGMNGGMPRLKPKQRYPSKPLPALNGGGGRYRQPSRIVVTATDENGENESRDSEDDEERQFWQCAICTLQNGMLSSSCNACGTPRSVVRRSTYAQDDDNMSYNTEYEYLQGNRQQGYGHGHGGHGSAAMSYLNQNRLLEYSQMRQLRSSKAEASEQDFKRAASEIACYNDNPLPVFGTIRSVAKKLLKDDVRYRTLDTTNPKVTERLIGYEGVLDFLLLLGFEADLMGQKLVCAEKPPVVTVKSAIEVLNQYEQKLGKFRKSKKRTGKGPKHASQGRIQEVKEADEEEEDDGSDNMTLQQIVLWCSSEYVRDNETMETLIMCHRDFSTSLRLLLELRKRFFVSLPQNIQGDSEKEEEFVVKTMKPIQLNVVKNLRNWMKQYWVEDFAGDDKVQEELKVWINKMREHSDRFNWNKLLAQTVENEFQRYLKNGVNQRKKRSAVNLDEVEIPRKFTLSSLSPEEVAEQMCIVDFRVFSQIKPRECLGQAWKKKNNKERAPNILAMIAQFNNLTKFVQLSILNERTLKERAKMIKRIIKIGERFRELKNYNSLCAVFSALNSAPIHRQKHAWTRVPQKQMTLFEQFKVIFATTRNHYNLRTLFRNAPAPCIPHIGIFLQDLVFIDDGNDDEREVKNLERTMVNFSKHVRMADRIKNINMYQQHPYSSIKENYVAQKALQMEFDKVREFDEDAIWELSTEVKRRDAN